MSDSRTQHFEDLLSLEDVTSRVDATVADLQVRMANLEESVRKALHNFFPKVEALLSNRGPSATAPMRPLGSESRDADGFTPLHLAAAAGDARVVLLQLLAGVDVHARGPRHRTALHLCAEGVHARAAHVLLAAGADGNAADSEGRTALMTAAAAGHATVGEVLLRYGVDANLTDHQGHSALKIANYVRNRELYLLIARYINRRNSHLVHTLLRLATEDCAVEAIVYLIRKNKSTDADIIDSLSRVKNCASLWAFEEGKPGILWSKVPEIALRTAARDGRTNSLKLLIDTGINLNAHNDRGYTALMWTCLAGRLECCNILIKSGSAKDVKDAGGNTAMDHARRIGNFQCVDALVRAGAKR